LAEATKKPTQGKKRSSTALNGEQSAKKVKRESSDVFAPTAQAPVANMVGAPTHVSPYGGQSMGPAPQAYPPFQQESSRMEEHRNDEPSAPVADWSIDPALMAPEMDIDPALETQDAPPHIDPALEASTSDKPPIALEHDNDVPQDSGAPFAPVDPALDAIDPALGNLRDSAEDAISAFRNFQAPDHDADAEQAIDPALEGQKGSAHEALGSLSGLKEDSMPAEPSTNGVADGEIGTKLGGADENYARLIAGSEFGLRRRS
jgi:hypothetical protein